MNLHQLEYIIALNEHRHFGRAAEACNVAQPSLSTMIQKLEDELGTKIFDRSKQPISPTPTGVRLLKQASVVLRQVELLKDIVTDEEESLGGELKLGILPTIAPYLIPRLIPLLDKELPKLKINFIELTTNLCLEGLELGELDMAIIASPPNQEGLESKVLFYEEFFAYVSREHKLFTEPHIRSSQVDSEHLWLLDEGHCFRDQLLRFCELKRATPHQYNYERGSLETFMHLVEQGNGLTFIPELAVDSLSESNKELVRTFTIPRPTRAIHLALRSDCIRQKLYKELSKLIASSVPERMLSLTIEQKLSE